MTELFMSDSFARHCTAHVLACDRQSESCTAERWAVQLTQTVLYPQSGGQPSDCGTIHVLSESSKAPTHAVLQLPRPVVDVQRMADNHITHTVTGLILPVGSKVQVSDPLRAPPCLTTRCLVWLIAQNRNRKRHRTRPYDEGRSSGYSDERDLWKET